MTVTSVQLVAFFEKDDRLPLRAGPVLLGLEKAFDGKVAQLNVARGAPADAPRFAMHGSALGLLLGLSRLDLTAAIPGQIGGNPDEVAGYMLAICGKLDAALRDLAVAYSWAGVLWTHEVVVPSAGGDPSLAIEPLTRQFIPPWLGRGGRHAAFQALFGDVVDGKFVGFTMQGYQNMEGQFEVKLGQSTELGLSGPQRVLDAGLQVIVDANTRERPTSAMFFDDVVELTKLQVEAVAKVRRLAMEVGEAM